MHSILFATVAILTSVAGWQNNFYAFVFGCVSLIAAAILFSTDRLVAEIKASNRGPERTGREFGRAINAAASTGWRNSKGGA